MTTALQATTNAANAEHSTGPKTTQGKGRASKNALRHGLRSELPVLPGEQQEDWEAHRAGVLQSLAPAGTLEEALASRVALCLWRLNRVSRYETTITAIRLEEACEKIRSAEARPDPLDGEPETAAAKLKEALEALAKKRETVDVWEGTPQLLEQLLRTPDTAKMKADDVYGVLHDLYDEAAERGHCPELHDEEFLAALGVPRDELDRAFAWEGWTVGMVKRGLARMAAAAELPPDKLRARAVKARQEVQDKGKAEVQELERQAKDLRRRVRVQEERARQRLLLPDENTLGKVTRYEAHLSRQMLQALHTLERLQAARAGQPVPPPAALDVTVEGEAGPALERAAAALDAG
jgi:hypothetical protein